MYLLSYYTANEMSFGKYTLKYTYYLPCYRR